MSLAAVEKKVEGILKYSTPVGHLHHAVLFVGRFCTLNLLTALHSDDLREWKCDTVQPGCTQICNNHFSPISHIRFFNLQIIILTFPRLIFHLAATWEESKAIEIDRSAKKQFTEEKKKYDDAKKKSPDNSETPLVELKEPEKPKDLKKKGMVQIHGPKGPRGKEDIIWTRPIARHYVAHLFAQLFLEIMFFLLLDLVQQFQHNSLSGFNWSVLYVPEEYICDTSKISVSACQATKQVTCFIPRSYDKTIFLWYHIIMSLISIILLVLDTVYTVQKHLRKKVIRLKERRKNEKESKLNNQISSKSSSLHENKKLLNYW